MHCNTVHIIFIHSLLGGTTEEIEDGFDIKCTQRSKPEIAKVTENMFIATHIEKSSLRIGCPEVNKTIHEGVVYGVLKIVTGCSRRLFCITN